MRNCPSAFLFWNPYTNQHHLCLLLKYSLISLVYKKFTSALPGSSIFAFTGGGGLEKIEFQTDESDQTKSPYEFRDKSWNSLLKASRRAAGLQILCQWGGRARKVQWGAFALNILSLFGHPVRQVCQESNCRRICTASREKLSPSEEGRLSGLVHMGARNISEPHAVSDTWINGFMLCPSQREQYPEWETTRITPFTSPREEQGIILHQQWGRLQHGSFIL